MCQLLISISLRYLHRASLSGSSETALPLTMALFQQLQIKQAFADILSWIHLFEFRERISDPTIICSFARS
jgi:hypothetical protein